MGIKLWPAKETFCFVVVAVRYKLQIEDCVLKCCYVKINPGSFSGTARCSSSSLPFTRSYLKYFTIAAGQFPMNFDDVYQGDIPESLVVGLVSSRAYSGNYTLNPYNFQHFNCNFAAFYVDGKSVRAQLQQRYLHFSLPVSVFRKTYKYYCASIFSESRRLREGKLFNMFVVNSTYARKLIYPFLGKGTLDCNSNSIPLCKKQ